jgi:hypothetical protein
MSRLSNLIESINANRRRLVIVAVPSLLVIIGVIVLSSVSADAPEDRGVVAEWNDTIARLGIDPVFPPEEDIYVGDLFAVITADRRAGSRGTAEPLLNRATKLDHIDMTAELIQVYENLPIFPDTEKRPEASHDPWPQKRNPDGLFATHPARGLLGIAAFPGFTIRHSRAASGGFSAWGFSLFGGSRQDNDLLEVRIPFAETYGVPSALAVGRLARYCDSAFTRDICTDITLRKHLSYVTPVVFLKATDEKTGRPHYLVDVEIALVNRVYLTRSIEQTRRLGRSSAAMVQALSEAATRLKMASSAPSTPKSETQSTAQTGADAPARTTLPDPSAPSQKQTQDILDRLDAAVPGGLLSLVTASDSQFELKQTFQRPVVIGYRAVRNSFSDALDLPYNPNGKPDDPKGKQEDAK